jgi:hypothetical protein
MLASIGLVLSSCGGSSGPKEVFPTHGELFVNGQPAAGARLAFHPKQGEAPNDWPTGYPRAVVDASGRFVVGTYGDADGCPAGEYIVLVTWPTVEAGTQGVEEAETVDRLQWRYASRETSQLSVTVDAKPTQLRRIDLK